MALIKGATRVLGAEKRHYHSQGDTNGRCPHCYTDRTEKIGVLTVDGSPRDVHKCMSCNTLHSGPDGGVRSLVDEAREAFETENVGFTALVDGSVMPVHAGPTNVSLEGLNTMNQKIEDLTNTIEVLMQSIKDMSQQNQDLMTKLMTDPLNGMRKAISEFNLE